MKNKSFSRIFNVIGNEYKNTLVGLIFLLAISAFVELVSILGLFFVFFAVLADGMHIGWSSTSLIFL